MFVGRQLSNYYNPQTFLHVSVILSTGRGRRSLYNVTSCPAAWSHVPSEGCLSLVPCSFWRSLSGVLFRRGSLSVGLCLGDLCLGGLCLGGLCLGGLCLGLCTETTIRNQKSGCYALNLLKIFVITVKRLEPAISCVRD